MKKMTTKEMSAVNGGLYYKCSLCKASIWTYFGVGCHAFKHPGKKAYVYKVF